MLAKRQREELPVMADFAAHIESVLDSKRFDDDISLALTVGEARKHAGKLKAWLAELCFLVETNAEEI